ncbi:hypothetical protein KGQ64_05005 [bacterium]|nr:hypothetical protein [bacterium]
MERGSSPAEGRPGAPRTVNALGIAILSALATSIPSLLVAVLVIGSDRAVVGALGVGLAVGALVGPTAWWLLGRRGRA